MEGETEEDVGYFHAELFRNGQFTLKKKIRDDLTIEEGDIVFFRVERVLSRDGRQKFPRSVDG